MLKRKISPAILAKVAKGRPLLKRFYYMVDLTTFEVGLYQSLDGLYSALTSGLRGVKWNVNYHILFNYTRYGKPFLINNRFLVGKTEHVYQRLLKKDRENLDTMDDNYPIQSPNVDKLPTIIGDL